MWQGLKVFESDDIDTSKFAIATMLGGQTGTGTFLSADCVNCVRLYQDLPRLTRSSPSFCTTGELFLPEFNSLRQ